MVLQFKRNYVQELIYEDKLICLGFSKNENNLFVNESTSKDEFDTIHHLINNSNKFLSAGFLVENIKINNKKINTNHGEISIVKQENNDWFDLKMIITCGNFSINFIEIIDHIKQQNRFFKLEDDSYFLIPLEWMSKYAPIANFAKIKDSNLQLSKNQYTILENLSVENINLNTKSEIK